MFRGESRRTLDFETSGNPHRKYTRAKVIDTVFETVSASLTRGSRETSHRLASVSVTRERLPATPR